MSSSEQRLITIAETVNKNDGDIFAASDELGVKYSTVERAMRRYKELNLHISDDGSLKKVLIFDIETAPMEAYVWSMWKNNVSQDQLIQDWSILCWAAKWLDGTEIYTGASWREGDDVRDDRACCIALSALLDEADIVVAHNGDKFDIKKVNTRLLKHGLKEPSPFKSVDTLKIAKARFAISSNRLDFIGDYLGVGRKLEHNGFMMWRDVLHGDKEAQERMLTYNVGDITLLEQVYLKLRGWDKRSPNINLDFGVPRCPCCGSDKLVECGDAYTNVSTFQAVQCEKCGKYSRYGKNKKDKHEMQNTMRNIV